MDGTEGRGNEWVPVPSFGQNRVLEVEGGTFVQGTKRQSTLDSELAGGGEHDLWYGAGGDT